MPAPPEAKVPKELDYELHLLMAPPVALAYEDDLHARSDSFSSAPPTLLASWRRGFAHTPAWTILRLIANQNSQSKESVEIRGNLSQL